MYSILLIIIKVDVVLLDCSPPELAVFVLALVSCTAFVPVVECPKVELS